MQTGLGLYCLSTEERLIKSSEKNDKMFE